ncbi:MAG: nuclease-like protein [Chromatiales bacterium]|nr:nuclease-like protein [Chromatiales bacterium]
MQKSLNNPTATGLFFPGIQHGKRVITQRPAPLALYWMLVVVIGLSLLLSSMPGSAREFSSYASVREDGSLRVGNRMVHLYGIYLPPTNRTCQTFFNPPVCGSRAALALNFRIQGFVHCIEKGTNQDRSITAICYVDRNNFSEGEDLGAYLIRRGWALALPGAPFEYHALERIAERRAMGVWGFTIDSIQKRD